MTAKKKPNRRKLADKAMSYVVDRFREEIKSHIDSCLFYGLEQVLENQPTLKNDSEILEELQRLRFCMGYVHAQISEMINQTNRKNGEKLHRLRVKISNALDGKGGAS